MVVRWIIRPHHTEQCNEHSRKRKEQLVMGVGTRSKNTKPRNWDDNKISVMQLGCFCNLLFYLCQKSYCFLKELRCISFHKYDDSISVHDLHIANWLTAGRFILALITDLINLLWVRTRPLKLLWIYPCLNHSSCWSKKQSECLALTSLVIRNKLGRDIINNFKKHYARLPAITECNQTACRLDVSAMHLKGIVLWT
jgi:hypothetical protein